MTVRPPNQMIIVTVLQASMEDIVEAIMASRQSRTVMRSRCQSGQFWEFRELH